MNKPLQRIFLLSHMRAYSSLIGHILGSHPEINGYYEMHRSYQSADDLLAQQQDYLRQERIKPGSRYLFDKLLHNTYTIDLALPRLDHAKILVALRKPEHSIKSIIQLFSQKPESHHYAEPAQAARYYTQRLQTIADFCRSNPHRYYYFDAELITQSTQPLLDRITPWLALNTPLSSHYQTFSRTGQVRAGDSSDKIKSGKILSTRNHYADIELPADLLQTAQKTYKAVRTTMISHARAIEATP